MSKLLLPVFYLSFACATSGASLNIPSADAPLTIDGRLDEELWSRAAVLPVQPEEFGTRFPAAGEMRAIVRGTYLCLSARLPETGRIVARSVGRNPVWWREDLVIWTFRVRGSAGRNVNLTLTVNPLGASKIEQNGAAADPQQEIKVSAHISPGSWSVEATIPLEMLAATGFASAERIRVSRPDAPELRWYWPGVNDRLDFKLAIGASNLMPPSVVTENWEVSPLSRAGVATTDPIATELVSLPHLVRTDAERKTLGTDRMWEKDLRARALEAALAERRDWEKIATLADWENFRDRRLAALKNSLGPFPERTPLHAEVTRRLDFGDGFILEDVVFESRPGLVVAANLYLPARISGKIPAIVVVHSHHAPKVQSELQDMGMTWARSGTAVLVMDQLGAGERLQSQPWPRESYYSRYALGMQLYLAGESLMTWMVWDLMRGIDLLLERPYIDPGRIVMLGAVAGGGDPAAVTAALDSRIAAVLPFNFGEAGPEEHYTEGPRGYDFETAYPGWGEWESTRCLRRSMAGQFFPWFICASVAPRRFVYSFEISWPDGVEKQPAWARYKKVFSLYGKTDHLDQVDGFGPFPGPGECTNVGGYLRKKIYPILHRWLDFPIPLREYHNVRPDSDLTCLTAGAAAERKPKPASEIAYGMAQERLSTARQKLAEFPAAERLQRLRGSLAARLGDIEPSTQAVARNVWTKSLSGFVVEGVELQTGSGLSVPLLILKPRLSRPKRLPVVLALADGGKDEFLAERSSELAVLLQRGIAVCLPDLLGTGETLPASSVTSLAATELMLGNTALGARLKNTRAVVRYLAGRADLDAKRIGVWGDSIADVNPRGFLFDQSIYQQPGPKGIRQAQPLGSLLALLAGLYEDDVSAIAMRRGLASYLSVLRDRFCYVPLDVIVPGILESADLTDILAALAPRAVLMEGPVDGRNCALSSREAEEELLRALAAYRDAPSQLVIREHGAEPELAVWLAGKLSP
ncbi:MAG: acetylxylan esterase [Terriglobia bacterium]